MTKSGTLTCFVLVTTRRHVRVLACTPIGATGVFTGRYCTCGDSHRMLEGERQPVLDWAHGECLIGGEPTPDVALNPNGGDA